MFLIILSKAAFLQISGLSNPANIFSSFSNLSGKLPSFEHCNSVYNIELQGNRISGSIPKTLSKCQKLLYIELSQNELTGVIPPELASLPCITVIDLSHNTLTGMIPPEFQKCAPLESFNVSFNHLSGPIPSDGLFRNITAMFSQETQVSAVES
jgi:Leucine-rich repeat (LRR) protein